MTQITDRQALRGMRNEYEELAIRLSGQDYAPGPDGAALRDEMRERLDSLWQCIEDHEADMASRDNDEPDSNVTLGLRY